jgi:hypothetical protein
MQPSDLCTLPEECNVAAYRVPSYMGGSPVASKHFENEARRQWWSVHVEAWRRSGLSQSKYCRAHRLTETTFNRWLKSIDGAQTARTAAELLREQRRLRRRGGPAALARSS